MALGTRRIYQTKTILRSENMLRWLREANVTNKGAQQKTKLEVVLTPDCHLIRGQALQMKE
jgi:hypothetical protein